MIRREAAPLAGCPGRSGRSGRRRRALGVTKCGAALLAELRAGETGLPQDGQPTWAGVPHSLQNFAPADCSAPAGPTRRHSILLSGPRSAFPLDVEVEHVTLDVVLVGERHLRGLELDASVGVQRQEVPLDVVDVRRLDEVLFMGPPGELSRSAATAVLGTDVSRGEHLVARRAGRGSGCSVRRPGRPEQAFSPVDTPTTCAGHRHGTRWGLGGSGPEPAYDDVLGQAAGLALTGHGVEELLALEGQQDGVLERP